MTQRELKSSTSGSPNLSAVASARLSAFDDGTGSCTVTYGFFGYFPKQTKFPNGVVTIWCDDSYAAHRNIVAPHLARYGWAGSAAIICEFIDDGLSNHLTMTQLRELRDRYGWEVNPHSYTLAAHAAGYPALADKGLADVQAVKSFLTANGFGACDHFAWPLGAHDAESEKIVSRYYSTGRGTISWPLQTTRPGEQYRTRSHNIDASKTLATLQSQADVVKANGGWGQFHLHNVVESGASGQTSDATTVRGFIDYLYAQGIPVLPAGDVWNAGLVG